MSGCGSNEHDGKIAGGGCGNCGKSSVEQQHRHRRNWQFTSERCVHIHTAKILSDRLQLLQQQETQNIERMRMACMCWLVGTLFHQRESIVKIKVKILTVLDRRREARLVIIVGGRPRSRERVNAEQPSGLSLWSAAWAPTRKMNPTTWTISWCEYIPLILVTEHDLQIFKKLPENSNSYSEQVFRTSDSVRLRLVWFGWVKLGLVTLRKL